MAKKGESRERVTLRCKSCKSENYRTEKNKKNTPDRLLLNKYCKKENRVTEHEEKK